MSGPRTFHVLDALEASPARTRRIWSQEAKDVILAEASAPGANVSAVARAHGVSVSQVFGWRRVARKSSQIATPGAVASAASEPSLSFIEIGPVIKTEPAAPSSSDLCEIAVAGVVLRIGSGVPAKRVAELIRAARLA
ncbi:MAG: transposase [Hyphomicrobiaceae bacterium]|nr:transposase [Hyphomicrobiaceae bacterium]